MKVKFENVSEKNRKLFKEKLLPIISKYDFTYIRLSDFTLIFYYKGLRESVFLDFIKNLKSFKTLVRNIFKDLRIRHEILNLRNRIKEKLVVPCYCEDNYIKGKFFKIVIFDDIKVIIDYFKLKDKIDILRILHVLDCISGALNE